jgi:predicted nucleotidyltransferase
MAPTTDEFPAIAAQFGAGDVRVIGSVARGTGAPTSDLDCLVTLEPERSLFDLGGLQVALENLLGCLVHVVTDGHAPSATPTGTRSDDRQERLLARLRA